MPGLDDAWARLRRHQAAVAADPSSAEDWVAIASLLSAPPLLTSGGGRVTFASTAAYAKQAARRALELDPGSAEAHRILGYYSHFSEWDLPAAESWFRRAIDLGDRNRAPAQLALLLVQLDRDDDAETVLPLIEHPRIAGVAAGQVRYLQRRFDEAVDHTRPSPFWNGLCLCAAGRPEEAVPVLADGAEAEERNPGYLAAMAYAAVLAGDAEGADLLEAELRERRNTERVVDYQLATVAAARGDVEAAFLALEKAVDAGANWPLWLPRDVRFDGLRSDPRFDGLLARLPIR